jgi:hypothetical protein
VQSLQRVQPVYNVGERPSHALALLHEFVQLVDPRLLLLVVNGRLLVGDLVHLVYEDSEPTLDVVEVRRLQEGRASQEGSHSPNHALRVGLEAEGTQRLL